jgi:hypothetical protein
VQVDKNGERTLAVVPIVNEVPEGLMDDVNGGLGYVYVRKRVGDGIPLYLQFVYQNLIKNDEEVFARIKDLVVKPEALQTGVGASEAARTLGVAPPLAKEYLLAAESKGFLCRDDGPDGLRFYINFFKEINPK